MRCIPLAMTITGVLGGVLLSWFALSVDTPLEAPAYQVFSPLAFYLLLTVVGILYAFKVSGVRAGSVLYSVFITLSFAGVGSFYIFNEPTTINVFGFLAVVIGLLGALAPAVVISRHAGAN